MEIKVFEAFHDDDWRSALKIVVEYDNSYSDTLEFMEGEPEDASLGRDYSDVYKISTLLQKAYIAGKLGEEINVHDTETVSWMEI